MHMTLKINLIQITRIKRAKCTLFRYTHLSYVVYQSVRLKKLNSKNRI